MSKIFKPHQAKCIKTLENVVRSSFSMRRKTLRNNLKGILEAQHIEALGIDPTRRPETLSLVEFIRIADYLFTHQSPTHSQGNAN